MKLIGTIAVLCSINATLLRGGVIQTIGYSIVDEKGTVICRQDETASECNTMYPGMTAVVSSNSDAHLTLNKIDDYNYEAYAYFRNGIWAFNLLNDVNLAVVGYSRFQVELTQYIPNPFNGGVSVAVSSGAADSSWDSYGFGDLAFPYAESGGVWAELRVPSSTQYGDQIPITLLWDRTLVVRDGLHGSGLRYNDGDIGIRIALAPVPEPSTVWQLVLGLGVTLACFRSRKSCRER